MEGVAISFCPTFPYRYPCALKFKLRTSGSAVVSENHGLLTYVENVSKSPPFITTHYERLKCYTLALWIYHSISWRNVSF